MSPEIFDRARSLRSRAAERDVPSNVVERWIRTLRPCALLQPDGDGPVVARLGGNPELPLDAPNPRFPLIATVDCAALPRETTDHLDG